MIEISGGHMYWTGEKGGLGIPGKEWGNDWVARWHSPVTVKFRWMADCMVAGGVMAAWLSA